MSIQSDMRLSEFIRTHMELILQAWEKFARTIEPPALTMDSKALRNHASHMLNAIADDLDRPQTLDEEISKSEGNGQRQIADTAAETHAIARLMSGYTIEQLASEYRVLRSSVLRMWAVKSKTGLQTDFDDIARFNEAIDQALAESIARYSSLFNQSRNLFLAILGHDLRNPLGATISGANLMMLSDDMDTRYRKIALRIYNSGRRMSRLVDDLIDYTRKHLGSSLPIAPKPTDFAEIAQIAIDEIRTAHQEREIKFNVAGKLDGVWDIDRISQVISNLLGNAVQHGAVDQAIAVEARSENDEIVFTVNNQGPVIQKVQIQTIFEPLVRFVEPDVAHTEKENSLGLGLYIAREVVKAHGGTIDVRSLPIDGTTFTVRLPRIAPS
ncbi:ATP-binding protein [Undibacterium sp. TJN25]|uniref:ATP-binding protein n=1 Tax=Undibacterium sp. TJN25 TaxID=3413056 RepID=UPI003BF3D0BD